MDDGVQGTTPDTSTKKKRRYLFHGVPSFSPVKELHSIQVPRKAVQLGETTHLWRLGFMFIHTYCVGPFSPSHRV
jgi:hypothetical protein